MGLRRFFPKKQKHSCEDLNTRFNKTSSDSQPPPLTAQQHAQQQQQLQLQRKVHAFFRCVRCAHACTRRCWGRRYLCTGQ